MPAQQNFRSAFNGFNREDVVRYLEYINSKHTNQVNQLTAEAEELRARLTQRPDENLLATIETLRADYAALEQQLEESKAANAQLEERCAQLEERCAQSDQPDDRDAQLKQLEERCAQLEQQLEAPVKAVPVPVVDSSAELEAYRRAERTEREAKERAELVYYQANGVLTEATAKVDGITAEITDMADQVMSKLTQLQMAVSSSKQALQDASSIMNTIRPNK